MGCCNSNRPATSLAPLTSLLPAAPNHSDSVHLLLIKAYREKNASLALSLLSSSSPLRLKFRCKRLDKVQSFVCYLLASWTDQYTVVIEAGALGQILELSCEDKHALSALYMMAAESAEVAQALIRLKPLDKLMLVYGRDKQTALIASLLLGLLSAYEADFAVQTVISGGLNAALKVYSDLHHFEAKRDMLKAIYTILAQARPDIPLTSVAGLSQALVQANDVSLVRLQRLLDTSL